MNLDGNEKFITVSNNYIDEDAAQRMRAKIHPAGTIIFPKIGGAIATNKRRILSRKSAIDNNCLGITFASEVNPDWAFLLMTSIDMTEYQVGTAVPALQQGVLEKIAVALPPLAEQHRIVAKVDELMALCDQMEQARAGREAVRDRLTTASLARLTAPETDAQALPAEVGTALSSGNATNTSAFQSHARFALQSLPTLTTRPDQIKTLRQTILDLAVRGKLVEQDAKDEPASELLKRIREWQKASISQKKIRAPRKPLAKVGEDDQPYPLPAGWAFARLGEIIYIQSGDGLTAANMKDGPYPVFGGNGINGHHDCHNVQKPTLVIGRVGYYCGSVHVTPENAWVTDNAFITHFSEDEILLSFLVLLLNGTNLKEDENATAQPVISGSKIYPIVIGLPPLAEQNRIVAKVDALMALCDQLEASLTTTATTRSKLLNALLHEALEPAADALEAAE